MSHEEVSLNKALLNHYFWGGYARGGVGWLAMTIYPKQPQGVFFPLLQLHSAGTSASLVFAWFLSSGSGVITRRNNLAESKPIR